MKSALLAVILSISLNCLAQEYTRQDSLRGSITPERAWWDLKFYHLDIKVDPSDSSINGSVKIVYQVLNGLDILQVDLQPPLSISRVIDSNRDELKFTSEGNAHFVKLKQDQVEGALNSITVFYGGKPKVAIRPPWDGGFSWDKDESGTDFIHTNCQGIGASIWWPNKDHLYDEPDSLLMSINVPGNLTDISNGRLRKVDKLKDGTKTFHWFVTNPISNYVVNINIADYKRFSEVYDGEKGKLDMDYYVLPYNIEKAKKQFKDAPRMMAAFEHWFGPYPFYEDGYKLVEVPSTGMEHQSSITYGNGFANGYRGRDGSDTGWGMKFDFIIIHESAHEWFANNITYKDVADMWIHESFANYAESLFLEYHFGKEAGQEYVRGTRRMIRNDRPIIGDYDVNKSGSGDMYVKGGNMLNTLRTVIDDDEKWRSILRGLNETFYHQTVTTEQIESYISQEAAINLQPFFDQYLRTTDIPILQYYFKDDQFFFRWSNCVSDFMMPVKLNIDAEEKWIEPSIEWESIGVAANTDNMVVDPNLYIATLKITDYD